jgi:DNA repair protein RadC
MKGVGDTVVTELKIVQAAAVRLARGEAKGRPVLSSWSTVLDYCRTAMAFSDNEQFRLLFLDKRNQLIADELQTDHRPHARLPARGRQTRARTIRNRGDSMHNHPSGDPTPRGRTSR